MLLSSIASVIASTVLVLTSTPDVPPTVSPVFLVARQDVSIPNTNAGRRLREWLEVVAKSDDASRKAFIAASMSETLVARRGEERILGTLKRMHDEEQSFTVTKIESSKDNDITVLAKSKGTGIVFKLGVVTESAAPNKIQGLLIDTMGDVERH